MLVVSVVAAAVITPGSADRQLQLGPTTSAATTPPFEVSGVVLDARTHSPVPRSLVRLGNRAVLTDHEGVFRMPEVSSTSASFTVTKPGYYPSADGDQFVSRRYQLPADAITLLLYPEAIISGQIADASGESLTGLSVTAERSTYDDTGHHWFPAGQTQTTSDGTFRLSLPAGSYRVQVSQRGRMSGGTEQVMPLSVPAMSAPVAEAIHLAPGEESHLELRPEVRRSYTVVVSLDAEGHGFPTLTARTASGLSIPLMARPVRDQNEVRVAMPTGTYTLVGTTQNQDGLFQARTQVTVTDHDLSGVVLRFTRVANLPIVVEPDAIATSDKALTIPPAAQLGLSLQAVDAATNPGGIVGVTMRRNASTVFSTPEGVYRLRTLAGGQWYVSSATCAGVDLLTHDLPVSSALDGQEVRVRVSNQTGTLSGKVVLSGAPAAAWIYLVASSPSAQPVVSTRSNNDGTFLRPNVPPGFYRAVALERKLNADLQSSAALNRFLDRVQTFTITPGEQHTLTLDIVPEQDLN